MQKSWIKIDNIHINLNEVSRIREIGPQGTEGYSFEWFDRTIKFTRDPEADTDNSTRDLLTRIRFYLYDNEIPNVP